MGDKAIYDALMERIIQLADAPWDAWPVYPGGDEPEFRETKFGEHGLLSFRVDESAAEEYARQALAVLLTDGSSDTTR